MLLLSALVLSACANEPTTPATTEANAAEAPKAKAKICDEEPVTGSRTKRCDRDPSNVEIMTREQLERMTTRSGLIPEDGLPRRGGR